MKRILVIDDNASFRKLLKINLEKNGYEVEEASDGISGCSKCFTGNFDLVIMDLFLPGKDGVQAIHELKEEFSEEIKIIAISGAAVSDGRTEFVLNQSKEHGANAVLKKPFEIEELLSTIKKLTT